MSLIFLFLDSDILVSNFLFLDSDILVSNFVFLGTLGGNVDGLFPIFSLYSGNCFICLTQASDLHIGSFKVPFKQDLASIVGHRFVLGVPASFDFLFPPFILFFLNVLFLFFLNLLF